MPGKARGKKSKAKRSKSAEASSDARPGRLVVTLARADRKPVHGRARVFVRRLDAAQPERTVRGERGTLMAFPFDLPPGRYAVVAEMDGARTKKAEVTIPPGLEVPVELTFPAAKTQPSPTAGAGGKPAIRREWFVRLRSRRDAPFSKDARRAALEAKRRLPQAFSEWEMEGDPQMPPQAGGPNWVCVGPRNIGGRVTSLAVHPGDGQTVFAGSANAGVWVTKNGGLTWTGLMRDEGALEIGALAIHVSNPASPTGEVTLYAGTGEYGTGTYKGVGILRSTDSGKTWTTTGPLPGGGNDAFSAILVDPTSVTASPSTTILYAAGRPGGVYKSANGGATWQQIFAGKNVTSLAMDPFDPTVLYAGVAQEGVFEYDPSTSQWSSMNTGLPAAVPVSVRVAAAKAGPNKVQLYAKLENGIYAWNKQAATWDLQSDISASLFNSTYNNYTSVLAVDPEDANIVFAGGVYLLRSANGGKDWSPLYYVHVDHHAVAFDPQNHLNVYNGNDGGVYHYTHDSSAVNLVMERRRWGLILTQFYRLGGSEAGPLVVGGGSQDNSSSWTVGGLTWRSLEGGDGSSFVIDPDDPRILYWNTNKGSPPFNGWIYKSKDGGATESDAVTGFTGGPWTTPLVLDRKSPPEPNRVLFVGGTSRVFRTSNGASTWQSSSPELGSEVSEIEIAPSNSLIVIAGTVGGAIWRSSDNGMTQGNWKNVTTGNAAGSATLPSAPVSGIAFDAANADVVYVAFGGTGAGRVFRGTSADGWQTRKWENVTGNLPDIHVSAIRIDPSTGHLYVATDVGVFRSTTTGQWENASWNLPNVPVTDLRISDDGKRIVAATYGYGMFMLHPKGPSPDVDLYVRDNKMDTGLDAPAPSGVQDPTIATALVFPWESADIKIDAFYYQMFTSALDGVEFDEFADDSPLRNDAMNPQPNKVLVQVHNRGPKPATNVKVKILYADASAGLPDLPDDFWSSFPNDWSAPSAWKTVDPSKPFQTIATLDPHTPKVLTWDNWMIPASQPKHTCMLLVVSADNDPVTRTDATPGDHNVFNVITSDKHVALRNLNVKSLGEPVPPPQGSAQGADDEPMFVDLHNPSGEDRLFDVAIDRRSLPARARVAVLVPEIAAQVPLDRPKRGRKVGAQRVHGREWFWPRHKRLKHKDWAYHVPVPPESTDAPYVPPQLERILIPARRSVRLALVADVRNADLGPGARLIVSQWANGRLTGGCTYVLMPASEEPAERRAPRKRAKRA